MFCAFNFNRVKRSKSPAAQTVVSLHVRVEDNHGTSCSLRQSLEHRGLSPNQRQTISPHANQTRGPPRFGRGNETPGASRRVEPPTATLASRQRLLVFCQEEGKKNKQKETPISFSSRSQDVPSGVLDVVITCLPAYYNSSFFFFPGDMYARRQMLLLPQPGADKRRENGVIRPPPPPHSVLFF